MLATSAKSNDFIPNFESWRNYWAFEINRRVGK